MAWNDKYQIGDGERTTDSSAPYVYRSYADCGIEMTQEIFNQIAQRFKIYFATSELKDIVFTPKKTPIQTTSDYYFSHLQIKFPKPSN